MRNSVARWGLDAWWVAMRDLGSTSSQGLTPLAIDWCRVAAGLGHVVIDWCRVAVGLGPVAVDWCNGEVNCCPDEVDRCPVAFRPKGTQVNSQGRKSLERVISFHPAATRRDFDLDLLV